MRNMKLIFDCIRYDKLDVGYERFAIGWGPVNCKIYALL